MFHNLFFSFVHRVVCEIMWKNIAEPDRPQMAVWCTRVACWIHRATNADPQNLIFIAFPLQHCLHERASMLCYT